MEVGAVGRFARVSDADGEMLRYLSEQGIEIGAQVEVCERQPFGGPTVVSIDGAVHVLGGALGAAMRIETASG